MPLAPVQTAHVMHTLTATDITNGFVVVSVVWDVPFSDTDYEVAFGVNDLDPVIDLSFAAGDTHNKTFEGLDAIVYISAAIPLIQGQLDVSNVNTPQSLSFVAPVSTLYEISGYLASRGDGAGSDSVGINFTWTDGRGLGTQGGQLENVVGNVTTAFQYPAGIDQFTLPVFAKAGTTVTVFTTQAGNPFHYDFSARVVQMPNNATIAQPGDQFIVNVIGIHN